MQGGSDGSSGASIQLYREVHKHAYLRHITSQHGKKSSGEQYWVVFCVHCDTVPYLEFYATQATSVTHQPLWRMSLTGATSVSGALVPQGRLYRLTLVTRENGITLAASTWDDMKDWVDTLRAKLREMKILGPGENLYSKPPEQLVRNRAPTRDPTSPLPPPPPGPAVYVPGTEIPARNQSEEISRSGDSQRNLDNSSRTPNHESPTASGELSRSLEHSSQTHERNNEVSSSNNDGNVLSHQDSETRRLSSHQHTSRNYISSGGETSDATNRSTVGSVERLNNSEPSGSGAQGVDGKEINRLHVSGNEESSEIEVTSDSIVVSQPYEALHSDSVAGRSRGNTSNSVTTKTDLIPKITSENVSKMKDFTKVDRKNKITSKIEQDVKVCKDGGIILYNDSLDLDGEQRSFLSSNPEQWDDLNAALLDNLCSTTQEDNFPSVSASSSRVAKISGMNVCLVDSLLPNRNTGGSSDDDFINDFDSNDDPVTVKPTGNTDVVNIKRDSKGYTQVDINAKKVEIFKSKLLLPSSPVSSSNSHLVTVSSGSDQRVLIDKSKNKPTPLPRTKLDGSKKTIGDEGKQGGVYVSLADCDMEGKSHGGIVLRDSRERRKVSLNRTSSVPDSIESEHILHAFCGEMVDASPLSSKQDVESSSLEPNVTIISVTNQQQQHSTPSTAIPIVGTQFNFDSVQINVENVKDVSNCDKKYVNVSVTNIDGDPSDDAIEIRHKNQRSDATTSGYGHIRHSTNRRGILDLEINNHRTEIKRTSFNNDQQPHKIKNVARVSKAFEIPEFKHNKNADPSKRSSTTHTKDFYESVFGPFNKNMTKEMSSDKSNVQVPKLVVNIPSSPHTSRKYDNITNDRHESRMGETSRQIVNIGRDTTSTAGQRRNKEESDYEFLSWNHRRGLENSRNISNINVSANSNTNVSINSNVSTNSNTNVSINSNVSTNSNTNVSINSNINVSTNAQHNNTENMEATRDIRNNLDVNVIVANDRQNVDLNPSKRSGLFTRGLTELNIMSKFRNLSANSKNGTDTKTPLLVAKQNNEIDNATTNSNSNNKKTTGERTAFSAKLNNIFNKFSDGRTAASSSNSNLSGGVKNRNIENVVRSESSLRRNWSEHNDRTAPPTVIRAKPLRPRPPAVGGVSPRRQPSSQGSDADNRRRSNSLNSARVTADEINSSTQNNVVTPPKPVLNVPVMSLREQQVMKLRNEIGHSGGIRLVLSSRDSPEHAVALVDIYSGVWVAGWKQRSHPLLYNALHIGDRLHSVDGCVVSNARQARRAIQNNTGPKVEIIIKRLPHGRVYALKRDSDRQDLGLMIDCATITGIVPNSPAHRAGVPATGTLTEVNGRPLNLLLKKGSTQVKDRLASVGREVSILVQPAEFVSLMRTALKAVRGCKEYIVQ